MSSDCRPIVRRLSDCPAIVRLSGDCPVVRRARIVLLWIVSPQHCKILEQHRQKLGRQPNEEMLEIDVNTMIWRTWMFAAKAAVHLGQHNQEHLRTTKNTDFEKVKQLFDISPNFILGQSNSGIFMELSIDWATIPRVRTALLNDRAVKLPKAKLYAFSDSALCLGGRSAECPRTVASWKDKTWSGSRSIQNIVNWIALMENQSLSNGKFPRTHNTAITSRSSKYDGRNIRLGTKTKRKYLYSEDVRCYRIRRKISPRSLVMLP